MLPPEQPVLLARQGFPDAQASMLGALTPIGFFTAGWYGTDVDDDRGCFAIVNETGPLTFDVGDFLSVAYKQRRVGVYVIGSKTALSADIILTRRAFLAIGLLAVEPIHAEVALIT